MPLDRDRYDGVSIAVHWLTALLVLVQVVLGLVMTSVGEGPTQNALFSLHKSVGLSIMLVVLFRLAWRMARPWPKLPASMPEGQARLARANHVLLYIMLVVMPVSGILLTVAGGYPLAFFGLVDLSGIMAKHEALSKVAETIHVAGQWVVYALVTLHLAGAFNHLLIRKDGAFQRMLPSR